ncbi:ATP synthase F1 subunit gamma [bacterium]|jgi:F-type H+-transporting ATPase subunit gamma|nr:ATP synthase F1 subunit gamma [bacterium]
MPSIKDLKKRITTVKNTQQTTKAMKMVSAAKLRRAQEAIQNQRPYAKKIRSLLKILSKSAGGAEASPFLQKPETEAGAKPKICLVLVTSDRGLCGGFNSNVIKTATRWVKAHKDEYSEIKFSFVGRRGHDFFKTKPGFGGKYYEAAGGKVSFPKAVALANDLQERFTSGEVNEVKIIYNEFKNAVSQNLIVEDFLPIQPASETNDTTPATEEVVDYLFKPSAPELLTQLVSKSFAIQAFRILLESQASEHGARMSAMENATKNAGEMIKKLTLQYNKQRQAGITKELLEIIAGSESQAAAAQ